MSNDIKTLENVQPGGRVRLREQLLSTSGGARRYVADFFSTKLRRHDFRDYILTDLAADFACTLAQHLSAQPSPGGQDALSAMLPDDARLVGVIADNIERGKLDHPGFYRNTQLAEALRRVLDAAQSGQRFPCSQWDDNDLLAALRGVENYLYYGDSNPIHTATVRAAINALAARQPVGQEPIGYLFTDDPRCLCNAGLGLSLGRRATKGRHKREPCLRRPREGHGPRIASIGPRRSCTGESATGSEMGSAESRRLDPHGCRH